jgi:hypothetical protein
MSDRDHPLTAAGAALDEAFQPFTTSHEAARKALRRMHAAYVHLLEFIDYDCAPGWQDRLAMYDAYCDPPHTSHPYRDGRIAKCPHCGARTTAVDNPPAEG